MSLNDMPDDVLIRLLNTAEPNDVTRAKRLNKRFNQLVNTYNLGRPGVKEFCVESRISLVSPTEIGRLRLKPCSTAPKRRTVVTMRREKGLKTTERLEDPSCSTTNLFVQENLRKIELQEKLSLDGVTLDEDFYKVLIGKKDGLSDSVCNLDYLTRIRVSKIFDDQSKWQRLAQQLDCDHMIELIAICSAGDDSSPTMILLDQFEQLDDSSISRLREAMNRMEEEEGVKLIDSRYVY
uniref:F-box domain-containing protein n=1 Tax=Caenorhabditis tropicalis TaxID=1561998 RepID=A0A1I7U6C0_9PELO